MTTSTKLTGLAAIDYAASHGVDLSKYADPTEDARDGLSVDEAREIAREDASLIWCIAPTPPEMIRHGSFGPIVWLANGDSRTATQLDMDTLPVGEDLSADEESEIEE